MAKKYAAIGSELWIGDAGSPEQFFKVASVGDISGPKKKRDTIESTTHDTDTEDGGYKDYITSLKDGQDTTFPIWLDPNEASHNSTPTQAGVTSGGLDYLFEVGDTRNMFLAYPVSPAARVQFKGIVTGLELDAKVGGGLMGNTTVKVTGKTSLLFGLLHKNPNL